MSIINLFHDDETGQTRARTHARTHARPSIMTVFLPRAKLKCTSNFTLPLQLVIISIVFNPRNTINELLTKELCMYKQNYLKLSSN